jgi:hypothetical protein
MRGEVYLSWGVCYKDDIQLAAGRGGGVTLPTFSTHQDAFTVWPRHKPLWCDLNELALNDIYEHFLDEGDVYVQFLMNNEPTKILDITLLAEV